MAQWLYTKHGLSGGDLVPTSLFDEMLEQIAAMDLVSEPDPLSDLIAVRPLHADPQLQSKITAKPKTGPQTELQL